MFTSAASRFFLSGELGRNMVGFAVKTLSAVKWYGSELIINLKSLSNCINISFQI